MLSRQGIGATGILKKLTGALEFKDKGQMMIDGRARLLDVEGVSKGTEMSCRGASAVLPQGKVRVPGV